ncbi:MAG: potassium channel protein [Candidatus Marinimicrobia bacterium]|nr:potassium channel protein [Candidatus Neomarinimicrobiota bacterium]
MINKRNGIIVYFILLVTTGSVGFYFLGGNKWSIIDSIYMTVITLSTVGYGEVHALNNATKIWAILLIIFGVTGIGAFIRTISEELIQLGSFRNKKMLKNISNLKEHYIICGYGRMGAIIADELHQKGSIFLIIEKDEKKAGIIRSKGMFCIHGDATSEETLEMARVDKASGVAVVLDTDQDNLFVTMSMKTANPNLFILSRCSREDNESKLIRAGANKVVNPYTAGGHRMAEMLFKPQVEDSISLIPNEHKDLNLTLDEISLKGLNLFHEKSIKQSQIKEKYDILIVGIVDIKGETVINPDSDTILKTSDKLLLMGEVDKMDLFKKELL